DEVEDALAIELAAGAGGGRFARVGAGEEPLEDQTRVDLRRVRGRGRAPGETVAVGATVARIAVAHLAAVLAAELERGVPGLGAELRGRNLVDRHSDGDVGSRGLLGMDSGQERRSRARVVPGTVAERSAVVVREAREHEDVVPVRSERLEQSRQLVAGAFGLRRPVAH